MHGFAGIHVKGADRVFVDHELSSEVTGANIFGQPKINEALNLEMIVHEDTFIKATNFM
jgi:hypothetical protein